MLLSLLLLACSDKPVATDSAAEADAFCSTVEEGGTILEEEGGATGASGSVWVRVITSETEDPRDPLYVAFKEYALENLETGGVATTGQTSGDGLVEEVLGEGRWSFRAAYPRGSRVCLASLELQVTAGKTQRGCALLTCPE